MIWTSMTCVYLGLDVGLGPAVLLQPLDLEEEKIKIDPQKMVENVQIAPHSYSLHFIYELYLDLAVEVTNVANNSVVLHLNGRGFT